MLSRKSRDRLGFTIIIISILVALPYVLDFIYPDLFATVIFEDYTQYDERIAPGFLFAGNYLIGPNERVQFMDIADRLSNPSSPQCKSNSCEGTSSGKDSYGCETYRKTVTMTQKEYSTAEGCSSDLCCNRKFGNEWYPYRAGKCQRDVKVEQTVSCGGATLGTCQGDSCIVMGSCEGNDDDDTGRFSYDSQNIFTLQDYKLQNNNRTEGVLILNRETTVHSGLGCRGEYNNKNSGTYYEDDYWLISASSGNAGSSNDGYTTGSYSLPSKILGTLNIKGNSGSIRVGDDSATRVANPTINYITKNNLYGYDIKIVYSCSGGATQYSNSYNPSPIHPTCSVRLGDKAEYSINSGSQAIEVFSSKITPGISDIYINGVFKQTIDFSSNKTLYVTLVASGGNPQLSLEYFGYKIPFGCQQGPEELLAVESFTASANESRKLSAFDLRYRPTKFCLEHPAIITDSNAQGSTSTAEVYAKWSAGDQVTVKAGQTLTAFYVFYNDGSIAQTCEKEAFDVERNKCTNLTGIVQFCSEGQYDGSQGACVVSPEIKEVCPYGRIETLNGKNVCVWNPPKQAVCEQGNYNSQTELCEYPKGVTPCAAGYTLNSAATPPQCENEPDAKIICPALYSFNPKTGYCEGEAGKVGVQSEEFCPKNSKLINGACIIEVTNTVDRIVEKFKILDASIFALGGALLGLLLGVSLVKKVGNK